MSDDIFRLEQTFEDFVFQEDDLKILNEFSSSAVSSSAGGAGVLSGADFGPKTSSFTGDIEKSKSVNKIRIQVVLSLSREVVESVKSIAVEIKYPFNQHKDAQHEKVRLPKNGGTIPVHFICARDTKTYHVTIKVVYAQTTVVRTWSDDIHYGSIDVGIASNYTYFAILTRNERLSHRIDSQIDELIKFVSIQEELTTAIAGFITAIKKATYESHHEVIKYLSGCFHKLMSLHHFVLSNSAATQMMKRQFPLVATVLLGFAKKTAVVRFPTSLSVVDSSSSFPSSVILNQISVTDQSRLSSDFDVLENFRVGFGMLIQHNSSRTREYCWIEKLLDPNFSDLVAEWAVNFPDEDVPYDKPKASENFDTAISEYDFSRNLHRIPLILKSAPGSSLSRFLYRLIESLREANDSNQDVLMSSLEIYICELHLGLLIDVGTILQPMLTTLTTAHSKQLRESLRRRFLTEAKQVESMSGLDEEALDLPQLFSCSEEHVVKIFESLIESEKSVKVDVALDVALRTSLRLAISSDSMFPFDASCEWMKVQYRCLKAASGGSSTITMVYRTMARASVAVTSFCVSHKIEHNLVDRRFSKSLEDFGKFVMPEAWHAVSVMSSTQDLYKLFSTLPRDVGISLVEVHAASKIIASMDAFLTEESDSFRQVFDFIASDGDTASELELTVVRHIVDAFVARIPQPMNYTQVAPYYEVIRLLLTSQKNSITRVVTRHQGIQAIRTFLLDVFAKVKTGSISVKNFEEVVKTKLPWNELFLNLVHTCGGDLNQAHITQIYDEVKAFHSSLRNVSKYIDLAKGLFVETPSGLTVHSVVAQRLRSTWRQLTVLALRNPSVWGILRGILQVADRVCSLSESSVFLSSWRDAFLQRQLALTADHLTPSDGEPVISDQASSQPDVDADAGRNRDGDNPADAFAIVSCEAYEEAKAVVESFLAGIQHPETLRLREARQLWNSSVDFDKERRGLNKPPLTGRLNESSRGMLIALVEADRYCTEYAPSLSAVMALFDLDGTASIGEQSHEILSMDLETISLQDFKNFVEAWDRLVDPSIQGIISELSRAEELIKFVRELLGIANVNLIDMVEDHSDSAIRAETISDFDIVRHFLSSLLRLRVGSEQVAVDARAWLQHLSAAARDKKNGGIKGLCDKIITCRKHAHGLRGMWESVARREQSTKHLIRKILEVGRVVFCRTQKSNFYVVLHWMNDDGNQEKRDASHLEELRSRALLLVNSAPTIESADSLAEDSEVKDRLKTFIAVAGRVMAVSRVLQELIELGHFSYHVPLLETSFALADLNAMLDRMEADKTNWQQMLGRLRRSSRTLNYFFSYQLWALDEFFSGGEDRRIIWVQVEDRAPEYLRFLVNTGQIPSAALYEAASSTVGTAGGHAADSHRWVFARSLLQLAHGSIDIVDYDDCYLCYHASAGTGSPRSRAVASTRPVVQLDPYQRLQLLASTLDSILQAVAIPSQLPSEGDATASVFYSSYETDQFFIPLLFAVYPDGKFFRNQLLVCDDVTTNEEIGTFLLRVFSSPSLDPSGGQLYCLLRVDALTNKTRSFLFKMLFLSIKQRHPENTSVLGILLRSNKLGCMDGLKIPKRTIAYASEDRITELVRERCPHVLTVNSPSSGTGKTAACIAHVDRMYRGKLATVLVADGINRGSFAQIVEEKPISPNHFLHLDISNVTQKSEISLAIFELLFIGNLQVGSSIALPPTNRTCYIENSDSLVPSGNDLNPFRYFNSLRWDGSTDAIICNPSIIGDDQIVCNYLRALKEEVLSKRDLNFPSEATPTVDPAENVRILSQRDCLLLLKEFIIGDQSISMNVLRNILSVLACQLREFSSSPYFQMRNISRASNREKLVRRLLSSSITFCTRSVLPARSRQRSHIYGSADAAPPEAGLIKWDDDNQDIVSISKFGTLTMLYRKLKDVDAQLKAWINSQMLPGSQLQDYSELNSEQLRDRLGEYCGYSSYHGHPGYVFTVDNFLKGLMIVIRVRARVPVIIMGEAGCGKTMLVRVMAPIYGAALCVLSIHAGLTRQDIATRVKGFIRESESSKPLWIFLDEINTCGELGFINALVCHRELDGEPVPDHVSFFAVCNPYIKRTADGINDTVGLTPKRQGATVANGLVYRVHPLPETMLDFIWDFGALSDDDELRYISEMMKPVEAVLVEKLPSALQILSTVVSRSQSFIRTAYGRNSVSMRDVKRVKELVLWFFNSKRSRKVLADTPALKRDNGVKRWFNRGSSSQIPAAGAATTTAVEYDAAMASIILALAHCYRCRLPDTNLRHEYDTAVVDCFRELRQSSVTADIIRDVIASEQTQYLERMVPDKGTALNESLLENVFVLLVCILNKIPVFLVGKPGSSKSLSVTLIESSLRGRDSDDDFFKTLPEVKFISYQGSESSTSDGILKVFDKAKAYNNRKERSDPDSPTADGDSKDAGDSQQAVIPVVLLDEVGLAEISPANPLKVLHSQLETEDDSPLDVAVVGISNWTLDASKMSRSIQLSRPEPGPDELFTTAIKIIASYSDKLDGQDLAQPVKDLARSLSDTYLAFYEKELATLSENFHGLRDFYSMCKYIGREVKRAGKLDDEHVRMSILRNFNGLKSHPVEESAFKELLRAREGDPSGGAAIAMKDLVTANLRDQNSRHLLLITNGDSVLNVMDSLFAAGRVAEWRIIIGSNFKEDFSENYKYRILSEIILSMEKGESLVLYDLDIYGSLYDMLNRNYRVIAGKQNCRVALGPFSNPMAHVHEKFKCVVVADESRVHGLVSPFLSRCEKQHMDFGALLTPNQIKVRDRLRRWAGHFCRSTDLAASTAGQAVNAFSERETFAGFCEGTLSSLVFASSIHSSGDNQDAFDVETVTRECKRRLVGMATCQGMFRARNSSQSILVPGETNELCDEYFADKSHVNLRHFLNAKFSENVSTKSTVTTFSKIGSFDNGEDLIPVGRVGAVAVLKLSDFDTEASFSEAVRSFYSDRALEALLLQCDVALDGDKLLLTKFIVDREMRSYLEGSLEEVDSAARRGGRIGAITAGGGSAGGGLPTTTALPDVDFASADESSEVDAAILPAAAATATDVVVSRAKSAVMLLYMRTDEDSSAGLDTYVSQDWSYTHIDKLEQDDASWERLLQVMRTKQDLPSYIRGNEDSFSKTIENEIITSYRTLKFKGTLAENAIKDTCNTILLNPALLKLLRDKVMANIDLSFKGDRSWLIRLSMMKEELEFSSSSLAVAVESYIARCVREPLKKCIYLLEKHSALEAYLAEPCPGDDALTAPLQLQAGNGANGASVLRRDIFLNHADLALEHVSASGGSEYYEIEDSTPGLQFPFSKLIDSSLREVKLQFLKNVKSDEVGATMEAERAIKDVLLDFLDKSATTYSVDDCFRTEAYCDDVARLFANSTCRSASLELMVQCVKNVLLRYTVAIAAPPPPPATAADPLDALDAAGGTDGDSEQRLDPVTLHLLLWKHSRFFASLVEVIQVGPEKLLEFDQDARDLQSLVLSLVSSFSRYYWEPVVDHDHNSLRTCDVAMAEKFPHLLNMCDAVGLQYTRFKSVEDSQTRQQLFELMPHCIGLWLVTDLTKLLADIGVQDFPPCLADDSLFAPAMWADAEGAPDRAAKFLDGLLDYCQGPLLLATPGTGAERHRPAVAMFMYNAAERFIPLVNARDAFAALDHPMQGVSTLSGAGIVRVWCKCLCQVKEDPPVSTYHLLIELLEKVNKVLRTVQESEEAFQYCPFKCFVDYKETGSDESIAMFDHDLSAVKDSSLEILLADMVHSDIESFDPPDDEFFEDSANDLCEVFLAMHKKLHRFSTLGLTERVNVLSFIRCFLDWSAREIERDGDLPEVLAETLDKSIGKHASGGNDNGSTNEIDKTLLEYLLKALRKPNFWLRKSCSEGGLACVKAPWMKVCEWDGADDSLTKLNPFKQDAYVCETAESIQRLFRLGAAPSRADMIAALDEGNPGKHLQVLVKALFLVCCRSSKRHVAAEDAESLIRLVTEDQGQDAAGDENAALLLRFVEVTATRFSSPHTFPGLVKEEFTPEHIYIMSIVVALVTLKSEHSGKNRVLAGYLLDASSLEQSFVLAAQSPESKAVISRYSCNCGYLHVVGPAAVTAPAAAPAAAAAAALASDHSSTDILECPQCKGVMLPLQQTDGAAAQTTDDPRPEDQPEAQLQTEQAKGYLFLRYLPSAEFHSEREMSPLQYHLLALIVRCSVIAGLYCGVNGNGFPEILGEGGSVDDALSRCWESAVHHWIFFCQSTARDGQADISCTIAHSILRKLFTEGDLGPAPTTPEMRAAAEKRFSEVCLSVLGPDIYAASTASAALTIAMEDEEMVPSFEGKLLEAERPVGVIARYLRIVDKPSFKSMCRAFYWSRENARRYPVIDAYLRHESKLGDVKGLRALLKWTNTVRKLMNFQIEATDDKTTVATTLQEKKSSGIASEILNASMFEDFAKVWNQLVIDACVSEESGWSKLGFVDSHQSDPVLMTPDSPILLSCVRLKGTGRPLSCMLQTLAKYQNDFLEDVLSASDSGGGAVERNIQDMRDGDIIDYDHSKMWTLLSRYVRSSLTYGAGWTCECDWGKIERLLMKQLVVGKAFSRDCFGHKDAFEEFRFKHEIFQKEIVPIDQLVPQEPWPDLQALRDDRFISDQTEVESRLLPAVESLLFVVQHQKSPKRLAEKKIVEFAEEALDEATKKRFKDYRQNNSVLGDLCLKHVESLYDVLEDSISATILRCLDAKYREELSPDVKDEILMIVVPHVGGLYQFESCWRRFIIRYLRGNSGLDPSKALFESIDAINNSAAATPEKLSTYADFIRWPKGASMEDPAEAAEAAAAAPRSVLSKVRIGQCNAVLQFINMKIQEQQEELARQQAASAVVAVGAAAVGGASSRLRNGKAVAGAAPAVRQRLKVNRERKFDSQDI